MVFFYAFIHIGLLFNSLYFFLFARISPFICESTGFLGIIIYTTKGKNNVEKKMALKKSRNVLDTETYICLPWWKEYLTISLFVGVV